MIIKEIELKDIRSHRQTTVDFTDGINIITGNTGSGKSSILMALEYALFGKIGEGKEEGKMLLRRGTTNGSISVQFEENGSEYHIKRGLKRTKIGVNNDDSVNEIRKNEEIVDLQNRASDLNNYILNVLKIESDTPLKTFESITYIKQDELKELIFDSGQTKQEYIDQLLQLNKYADTYDTLKDVITLIREETNAKKLEAALVVDENDLIKIESRIDELVSANNDAKKTLEELENELRNAKIRAEQIDSELKFYNGKKNEYTRLSAQKSEKISRIEKLKEDVSRLEKEITVESKNISNIDEKRGDAIEKGLKELEAQRDEKMQAEKSAYKSLYEKKAQEESKMDKLKNLEIEISSLTSEKTKIAEEIKKAENDLKNAEESLLVDELNGRINQLNFNIIELNEEKRAALASKICRICGENITDVGHLEKEYGSRISKYNILISELSEKINQEKRGRTKTAIEKELGILSSRHGDVSKRIGAKTIELTAINLNEIKTLVENDRKLYENLLSEEKLLTNEINRLRSELDTINRIRNEIKELELNKVRKDSLEAEIERLYSELDITVSDLSSLDFKQEELDDIERKQKEASSLVRKLAEDASRLKGNIESRDSELSENRSKLDELKMKIRKRDEFRKETEKRENFLALMDNLRKDIRDIREYVRNKFIKDFKALFQSRFLEIRNESEYMIDIDNDYNVKIVVDNEMLDARALSGGEKTSVALAYRMALSSIAALLGGINKNESLLMDEPTSGLDKEDINALCTCITRINDINQIIIVTHEDTLKNIADNLITITKTAGESSIK